MLGELSGRRLYDCAGMLSGLLDRIGMFYRPFRRKLCAILGILLVNTLRALGPRLNLRILFNSAMLMKIISALLLRMLTVRLDIGGLLASLSRRLVMLIRMLGGLLLRFNI